MMSDRIKRNIFFSFAIIGVVVTVLRVIDLIEGTGEWRSVVSAVVIYCCCFRFYLNYRRKVMRKKSQE